MNPCPTSRAFALLVLLLLAGPLIADPARSPVLPDPALTPGDVLTTDAAVVCVSGYTKTVRDVPQSVKNQVYRQYGVVSREPREYEVDHLISLERGGSNSIRNLWPQSYITQPLNARVKDKLENKLHKLVCDGKLPLEQAQREIAADWTKAYEKHIGPLPTARSTAPVPAATPAAVTPEQAAADVPGNPDDSCPESAPVKVSRSSIYHRPDGDSNYGRTEAQTCFANPRAAEQAGYRAPKR